MSRLLCIARSPSYEERLEDARRQYGPPPIEGDCDICGEFANTEITWYFRPSDLTGSRSRRRFCDFHAREAHERAAPIFGWEEAA